MTNQPFPFRKIHRRGWLAILVVVLFTAGCSAGSSDRANTESAAGGSTTSTADGAGDSRPSDGGGNTDEKTTTTDAPSEADGQTKKVVASVNGGLDGGSKTGRVPVRLDVRSVKRIPGDTVEVRFSLANTSDAADLNVSNMLGGRLDYDVSGLTLVDLPNDRRYLVLVDSKDDCLCSSSNLRVGPGDELALYAQFPAPPKDVKKVDLNVPGFDPINGLAIS